MLTDSLLPAQAGSFEPVIQYPGDDCCTLYERHNFEGARKRFCHDGSEMNFDMHAHDFNDKLSSWYCGKNTWYNFCNDGPDCAHDNGSSGAGHAMNRYLDRFDNRLSTLELGPYDPQVMGAVTVFEHYNCYGQHARFYWNPLDPDGGQYFQRDVRRAGLRNDRASSIMVPAGYAAILYEHYGFDGSTERF